MDCGFGWIFLSQLFFLKLVLGLYLWVFMLYCAVVWLDFKTKNPNVTVCIVVSFYYLYPLKGNFGCVGMDWSLFLCMFWTLMVYLFLFLCLFWTLMVYLIPWLMGLDGFLYGRSLRFQLQRPVSMDMLSATLLQLIFSLLKSLKILCPLRTIAMYVDIFFFMMILYIFDSLFYFWHFSVSFCLIGSPCESYRLPIDRYFWGWICKLKYCFFWFFWFLAICLIQWLVLILLFESLYWMMLFYRWVCSPKMVTPRMTWSFLLMTICLLRFVEIYCFVC